MSRKAPPRLYLKQRTDGREAVWIIRDGAHRRSTGCNAAAQEQAEKALADYIAGKYRAPTGLGQRLLVDEAVVAYLQDNKDSPSYKDFMLPTATPIMEWWSGRRIADVNKKNCQLYVKWRTSQDKKRHPNSKKKPQKITIATARHDLKTLRAAINSFKATHDPSLVVPTISLPSRPPARKDYWLNRHEVARRLNVARRHLQTRHVCRMLLIGVRTGTRPGATLKLRWEPTPNAGWIDIETGIIHRAGSAEVEFNKRKTPVRIHSRLLPHLKRWRDADLANGFSNVVHYMGEPIKRLRRSWGRPSEIPVKEAMRMSAADGRPLALFDTVMPATPSGKVELVSDTLAERWGPEARLAAYQPRASQAAAVVDLTGLRQAYLLDLVGARRQAR